LFGIDLGIFGHIGFPDAPLSRRRLKDIYADVLWR